MKAFFALLAFCGFIGICWCVEQNFVTQNQFNDLHQSIKDLTKEHSTILSIVEELKKEIFVLKEGKFDESGTNSNTYDNGLQNDTTIEERVTVLEFQVAGLNDDVTVLTEGVANLEEDLTLVESEQIIQDERILDLEIDTSNLEDSVENLAAEDTDLNIALAGLTNTVTELNTTLSVANAELTVAVSELDGRVQQLEVSGSVAFHVDLDEYTSIPIDSIVIFGQIYLNIGNGYNSETGEFTVPPGGAGLYYFYTNLWSVSGEAAAFQLRVNNSSRCRADFVAGADHTDEADCGAVVLLAEGDIVHVHHATGTDDSPVRNDTTIHNIFSGFRIAAE